MDRARRAGLLGLTALSLLWACYHATAVMAQGVRRTADLRSGGLELPADSAPAAPRPASSDPLIPDASLVKIFERGGMLMWPLLMCSVVTMVFVARRMQTRPNRVQTALRNKILQRPLKPPCAYCGTRMTWLDPDPINQKEKERDGGT